MKRFRSSIVVLVLILFLFGASEGCRKQPIHLTIPKSYILYIANQFETLTFNQLNLKSKITKSQSLSFRVHDIKQSLDKNKIVFLTSTNFREFDIYSVNIDGTNLLHLTKDFHPYFSHMIDLRFYFSPDGNELIAYNGSWTDFGEGFVIFNLNDSKKMKINFKDPLFKIYTSVFDDLDKHFDSLYQFSKQDCYLSKCENLIINTEDGVGVFNFISKTVTLIPILKTKHYTIGSSSWSADSQKIAFCTEDGEIYIYDLIKKACTKITNEYTTGPIVFLENGKKLVYSFRKKGSEVGFIGIYSVLSLEIEEIETKIEYLNLQYIDDETKLLVLDIIPYSGNGNYDKLQANNLFLFSLQDKSINQVNIPEIYQDSFIKVNAVFLKKNLFILTATNLFMVEITNIKLKKLIDLDESSSNDIYLSPDKAIVILKSPFSKDNQIILFDYLGKQIKVFSDEFQYDFHNSYRLSPYIVNSNQVFYVSSTLPKKDIFDFDGESNKITNLTKDLDGVEAFSLSPDNQQIAFLEHKFQSNQYSIYVMNLSGKKVMRQIESFQYPETPKNDKDEFKVLQSKDELILTWSPDSQYLVFVANNKADLLSINKVNPDGSKLEVLSDPKISSSQPNISPDGKKIIFIVGPNKQVSMMNKDGTNKKLITKRKALEKYFLPAWSPNSNFISYFEYTEGEEKEFYHNQTKKLNQKVLLHIIDGIKFKEIKTIACDYSLDEENSQFYRNFQWLNRWSVSQKYFVFLQRIDNHSEDDFYTHEFIANELADLKEIQTIKGDIRHFYWSLNGNQILLLESKEKDQINQLTLYDCTTNSYTPISQDVDQLFDACWSPDGKQILYSGTDSKTGQIVFKTSQADASNQKLLFTFGENPLERPSSIEKIEKLVWLK